MSDDVLKVLIAEPELGFRRALVRTMRDIDNRAVVTEVSDGSMAIHHLRMTTCFPHLVVAAASMEPLSGLDFLRSIRRGEYGLNRLLPVILVSENLSTEFVAAAMRGGVDGLLSKPCSIKDIIDRTKHVLHNDFSYVEADCYFGPMTPIAGKMVGKDGAKAFHKRKAPIRAA